LLSASQSTHRPAKTISQAIAETSSDTIPFAEVRQPTQKVRKWNQAHCFDS
jgi:hypothetical protein